MKLPIRILFIIVGSILLLDSIVLFAMSRINFGSIIPFLIGLVFCTTAIYHQKITQYLGTKPKLKRFWRLGWTLFTIWAITLFCFFGYIHQQNSLDDEIKDVDVIIVLGSGLVKDKPSPVLAERLDRAVEVFRATAPNKIVVTGSFGSEKTVTVAEAMADYLMDQHQIPFEKIILEDQSTTTELNLKNSRTILHSYGLDDHINITIVTSDFHTLRAAAIAKKIGFKRVTTAGANTPISMRYNSWLREYFAFISGWLLREY